jgi:4-hydroxybenzoate polyprenyltransferase
MLARPPALTVVLLFAAIGMAGAGTTQLLGPSFLMCALVLGASLISATALNDIADEQIDRVNIPEARGRPLITGNATRGQMLAIGVGAASLAITTGFLINVRVGAVVVVGIALNCAYSLPPVRLSGRGLITSLMLPLGYVAVPYLVGALTAGEAPDSREWILLLAVYVYFIGRIMLKDFRDVVGDRAYGKRTFLVRHGKTVTCAASAAFWIAGTVLAAFVFPLGSLVAVAFGVDLVFALFGLDRLHRADDYVAEQVIIGGIARLGMGMGITLLAQISAEAQGLSVVPHGLLIVGLTAFSVAAFVGSLRDVGRVAEIDPY